MCVQARRWCLQHQKPDKALLIPTPFPCQHIPFYIISWHINYPLAHLSHNMGEGPTSSTKICLSLLKPQLKSLHTFYGLFLPPRPCRGSFTGSFYCCYLQFLLWPPAYKSPTSSFFGIHFASLTKSPLSFIVTIWSCYRPPMSVLDIYSMRCLWTIFKSCLSDNCMGLRVRKDAVAQPRRFWIIQVQWVF